MHRPLSGCRTEWCGSMFNCLLSVGELLAMATQQHALIDLARDRVHLVNLGFRLYRYCLGRPQMQTPSHFLTLQ